MEFLYKNCTSAYMYELGNTCFVPIVCTKTQNIESSATVSAKLCQHKLRQRLHKLSKWLWLDMYTHNYKTQLNIRKIKPLCICKSIYN